MRGSTKIKPVRLQYQHVVCSLLLLIATLAHVEGRAVATMDVPGAYLNACMPNDTRV